MKNGIPTDFEISVLRVINHELHGLDLPQSRAVQSAAAARLMKYEYVMLSGCWYVISDKGKRFLSAWKRINNRD